LTKLKSWSKLPTSFLFELAMHINLRERLDMPGYCAWISHDKAQTRRRNVPIMTRYSPKMLYSAGVHVYCGDDA
jgi:hypothetical protein